ncbi:DNA polymerase III subunit delta [candidate division NPL-UPA2 bacterium]|nr:DNA polymerase III subunit delta [candidate division NPL-UPA2 bacterium]
MNYQQFLLNLEGGSISPLYLFSGPEEFLKEEVIRKLRDSLLEPGAIDLNYHLFYGKEDSGARIVETASTLPFMSEKRLVVVKEGEKLRTSDKKEISKYAQSPSPSTCLVLLLDKIDRRENFYLLLTKSAEEISFKPVRENDLIGWIGNRVKEEGKKIAPQAAFELKERVGGNLRELTNHLTKLFLYAGDKKDIGIEEVRALVGEGRETNSFALTEAISEKKKDKALKILGKILSEGRKAPEIIGLIAWQMRRIAETKSRITRGETPMEACQALGIFPYFRKKFISQVKKFSSPELRESFYSLLEADRQFKSGKLSPSLILEFLVIKLCA